MLSPHDVEAAELIDWRQIRRRLLSRWTTKDFATGLEFVNAIGAAAESADHHPDIDLRYTHVNIALSSHDVGGITERDVDLARTISALAADRGIAATPAEVQELTIALDTARPAAMTRFWAAALNVEPDDDSVVDSSGAVPTLWFQETDQDAIRFHLDIDVPPEQVQSRLDAALAAGGTLESDEFAPSWWVVADPDGNKVCICTWQGRDD